MAIKIPLNIIQIEDEGFHPHFQIKINHKIANVLLDTGASKTVFDINLINNFIVGLESEIHDKLTTGLGTSSMVSHKAVINKLEIGKLEILDFDAVLLDLSHVNQSYGQLGIEPIAGVIGCDIMVQFKAKIDFEKSVLTMKIETII
jgi:predicted aspartyl protease